MELVTNYAQIKTVVEQSPSLRSAFSRLKAEGLITVKYDAFAKSWKKVQANKAKKASTNTVVEKPVGNQETSDTQPKGRKPLPEINKFTVPTGSDGVRDQW
ncbi:hypothetical protein LA5095_06188 [Roseibium album]|uniref:Uncharacterized protein n=2 Tax=Roseibium album TaxID=311410 RepID=A0A0M7AW40_9HYPH|nr:hypothetical protein LA5094_06158 [Roseibium album]CTQ79398.1 hypothetical protein LA5096_06169 [Roseibium album]CTQ80947.1 hypothetical protein LA5095_06188 [Roseibium album]